MIPILDTPTIDLIVQEAAQSGITDILVIVSYTKYSIRHFYERNKRLEASLIKKKKYELYKKVQDIGKGVKIRFKFQFSPRGLGHAIYLARSFVKKQPFAVLLGDDVILKNDKKSLPAIQQLMNVYDKYHASVVGVKEVPQKDAHRYGIIEPKEYIDKKNKLCEIKSMVEKPDNNDAPSNLAITGRYILTPEIFKYLALHKIGVGGEIQLTDAILSLLSEQKAYALNYDGRRFDIGSKSGLVKASVDFALKDPEIRAEILDYILNLTKTVKK
jgi:UTP--glucose-1-phosphate uridylyltransferase